MERFFNTAGPLNVAEHYALDPLSRWDLPEVLRLIDQKKYFLVHAPRQTGKTTCLQALRDEINRQGHMKCLYVSMEGAQAARQNIAGAMQGILYHLGQEACEQLQDPYMEQNWERLLAKAGPLHALNALLNFWCNNSSKPIVLLMDEIDALVGNTLISILRQLRLGYPKRSQHFPQSIVLCGMRHLRDYRMELGEEGKQVLSEASPFNINSESLRLGDFSQDDVKVLYAQHTRQTGQQFEDGVVERVFELTQGQPWLVNALAYDICFRDKAGRDRSKTIMLQEIDMAKEKLIQRRETHLDQLMAKLKQERVRRVIEPMLLGIEQPMSPQDVEYVQDLGLIHCELNGEMRIANPIYHEIIPRQLSHKHQLGMQRKQAHYVTATGQLDMKKLLQTFQQFFRENADSWLEGFQYKETGPHLILQAFLQRIVNGGGTIHREYALGRRRTDLLVTWKGANPTQAHQDQQKIVLELKLVRQKEAVDTKTREGLQQTAQYMDGCGATEGHLLMFDRRKNKSWDERIWVKQEQSSHDKQITVWGL
ncbi:MAG: ATP-binding protein [Myxococcota bacterium]